MAQNYYESFKKKLEEIFMMDHAELDFGIYRIMNQKRTDIQRFLESELLPQVKQVLEGNNADADKAKKRMAEIAASVGGNIEVLPKGTPMREEYDKLEAQLAQSADTESMQAEVFSHLVTFFSRYYDGGDFLSKRRYKDNTYAIPYNGEEVKLHWANSDQYYIKTSEYFRNYTFVLPTSRKKVHFVLKDASTEQNNNRAANNMERRFALFVPENDEPIVETTADGELNIYFTYELMPKATKQDGLKEAAFEAIKSMVPEGYEELLTVKAPTAKAPNRTLLEKHLTDYTAKNSFDYFIHKDLGGFLRCELDFYIKNEVLHIDDLDAQLINSQLTIVRAIKQVGQKIIQMLAQLENFQKKLWLKKKFVVQSDYCITLDRVPEKLYSEIIANEAQRKEWVRLFAIDDIKGDLTTEGYSEPLTIEFLKQNPFLVLDTAFFDAKFKHQLVKSMENIDEQTNGLLIYGDNFQTNRLFKEKLYGSINCVFIDPPYNTGDDDFVYKDNYQSSSWLSMLNDRLDSGMDLIKDEGMMYISIGDEEQEHLSALVAEKFGKKNLFSTLIWEKKKKGSFLNGSIAKMKDYVLCIAKDPDKFKGLIGEIATDSETYPCVNADNPRDLRVIDYAIPSKYRERNYKLEKGSIISAGNMNLILHSDLVIEDGWLVPPLKIEGNWRYSQISMEEYCKEGTLYLTQDLYLRRIVNTPRDKRMRDLLLRTTEDNSQNYDFRKIDVQNLNNHGWGSNEDANEELLQIIGEQYAVSYPKPSKLIAKLLVAPRLGKGIYMDYFAGSGTSGHSVLTLNRLDGGNRKYILADMGDYFYSVALPRIKKIVYSEDWKDGKPISRQGISQCFKYIRLEQYEDTLNNLEIKKQQTDWRDDEFHESYMLSYMLDTETRDSLLNLEMFVNPFNMSLKTTKDNELVETKVDMVETFNYLIGLNVETEDWFENDNICVVQGKTHRRGLKTLVIWRNREEIDNEKLCRFFERMDFRTRDTEFDLIYVNGDNTLPNLRRDEENWKVVLTEEEFQKRMFENE